MSVLSKERLVELYEAISYSDMRFRDRAELRALLDGYERRGELLQDARGACDWHVADEGCGACEAMRDRIDAELEEQ